MLFIFIYLYFIGVQFANIQNNTQVLPAAESWLGCLLHPVAVAPGDGADLLPVGRLLPSTLLALGPMEDGAASLGAALLTPVSLQGILSKTCKNGLRGGTNARARSLLHGQAAASILNFS